jgi:hypothetical protein
MLRHWETLLSPYQDTDVILEVWWSLARKGGGKQEEPGN